MVGAGGGGGGGGTTRATGGGGGASSSPHDVNPTQVRTTKQESATKKLCV